MGPFWRCWTAEGRRELGREAVASSCRSDGEGCAAERCLSSGLTWVIAAAGEDVYGYGLEGLREKIPGPAGTSVKLGFKTQAGQVGRDRHTSARRAYLHTVLHVDVYSRALGIPSACCAACEERDSRHAQCTQDEQ